VAPLTFMSLNLPTNAVPDFRTVTQAPRQPAQALGVTRRKSWSGRALSPSGAALPEEDRSDRVARGQGGGPRRRGVQRQIRGGLLTVLLVLAGAVQSVVAAAPAAAQDAASDTTLIQLLRDEASAYEHGDGVERDGVRAAELYCRAARMGDAQSQFNLGWLYTNGRGVERSESTAAFFFHAAAEQGYEQARRMLGTVGGPPSYVPECMLPPARIAPAPLKQAAVPSARPGRAAAAPSGFTPQVEVLSRGPKPIVDLVKQIAPEYRLEPQLVLSIIETESNFDVVALSPKNAKGLMQLIPETAARFGVRNPYDPVQNIRGGMAYLRWLMAYFEGDISLVAAAYNAGERAVERYRGVPPYLETLTYVRKVLISARMVDHAFDASVTEPSPQLRAIRDPRRAR